MFNKIIVATSIALLAGCVPMQNQYDKPSYSSYVPPKPKIEFSGWDDNGKLKTKSSIQGTPQISGKTILNEDTIVCESNEILLKKAENLSKYPTGTLFIEELENDLNSKKSIHRMNLDRLLGTISKSVSDTKSGQINNELDISTKEVNAAKLVMNTCTINKNPSSVEVVERKPISKMAKIKWNGAEVWTYESHLTFRN